MKIREFDGSGGRIGLFKTHFSLRSRIRLIFLSGSRARARIGLNSVNSVIQSQELEN